ncbi:A-kinase anchor protein 13 isoform X2 [Pungitius pungitius]|uniref:A-kinase anchor protein 13 isoform X2 n=1 Tax=Pungitius pungitius TaxID=134920 RepID=UPI002E13E1DE
MKLNPQQAPLYGLCVITVQLADGELAADDESLDYFLLFSGSTQRHLTSTLRSSHDTLQALCPAHDCCEVVRVTLCSASRGVPESPEDLTPCLGRVAPLAEHPFGFVQDLAFDLAQFLVSTAGRVDGLEGALLLDECRIPSQECERLDEKLALALHHLTLPPGWSLLGNQLTNGTDLNPQETLLHFSARRGLLRVTRFLLQQAGAGEALRLANRQGHTPSTIATLRGHERLHELLAQAETDKGAEPAQLVSTDARLVCHLPALNTHTLTLSNRPGHDPPTLRESVEQLLHLICHLHAKGVSALELKFESLHTAAECCDGAETEITRLERPQLPATASDCLDTTRGGSWVENCSVDCGHGGTAGATRDWSLSVSAPGSEVRLREHGLGPPADCEFPGTNTGRDCFQTEPERREQPAVSPCDEAEGAQSGEEGARPAVGIPPPSGADKRAEESDREAVIREGQEAAEGEDAAEQEAEEDSTATRREETTSSDSTDPIKLCGDTKASTMGQSPSSDTSDCEMKECPQEGGTRGGLSQAQCEGFSFQEGEAEREGLTEPVTDPRGLPDSPPIDCRDVTTEPDSAVPRLLVDRPHEREPPPDINSLEQNQETAGGDYAAESSPGPASVKELDAGDAAQPDPEPEPGSTHCIQSAALPMEEPDAAADSPTAGSSTGDPAPGLAHCSADPDPAMTHSLSSDNNGSFRSGGSSTADLFHPTLDDCSTKDQNMPRTATADLSSTGLPAEEPIDSPRRESGESHPAATAPTVTESEPVSQPPPSQDTTEALNPEGTGEELYPEPPEGHLSPESWDTETEGSAPEVPAGILPEPGSPDGAGSEVEEGRQSTETCDQSAVGSAEESVDQRPGQRDSEMKADERSRCDDRTASEGEALSPRSEGEEKDGRETPDAVDGALQGRAGAVQELEAIMSGGTVIGVPEDENAPPEETDVSMIHRDREASFHQPCNTQHSGSSHSLPRVPSLSQCVSSAHRDCGSDVESLLIAEPEYDSVFTKSNEPVTGGDSASEVSVSCSSTDDTASVGPSSSSPEGSQGLECSWSPEEAGAPIAAGGGGGAAAEAEEEAKDRVTEVPRRSSILRNSLRSLSPLRRHSWGPGKNNGADSEMNQRSSIRGPGEGKPTFHRRSYSLEGLSAVQDEVRGPTTQRPRILEASRMPRRDGDDRGSLVSLTEEQEELGQHGQLHDLKSRRYRPLRNSCPPMTLPLTKSVSMLAISQRDTDGMRSFSSASGSLAYSISEEEPGPLRSDTEGKSVTKVSRTFSYLKNKMYKKTREKDRDKREKDKEVKEKDKKTINSHLFTPVSPCQALQCFQCNKAFNSKEAFQCTYCNASVHKSCRDSLPVCAKVKMKLPKQQFSVPDSSPFPTVTMRNKAGGTRERPWSAILCPEDHPSLISSRRHTSIMTFHGNNLSKSLSISNIAGPVFDDMPIKGLRYLSQSTDSLNRTNQVTESMESLTDEGTEMMDGQLMGEFEAEAKELEADSWSLCAEQQQYLQQLDKELAKKQDVIYELMQTEMHHIRTLRIMSEVYSKGLQKEVQLELQMLEKLFPAIDELLELHTQHLLRLLERKKESQLHGGSTDGGFIINRIGDILVSQFSGCNGESMKRVYGRFCSRHNEAVNFYKDLLTKDKRFKAFIKKKMSSSIVRRLGIPECILLVTQRITKYPVLIQRILQHTKESEEDHEDLTHAVRLVKEVIAAVDNKVNEHEKRRRLKDFHGRMDSKSIMMTKSGQIFAKEDLLRRRLIHDGVLQLKNCQGRPKDVHALLLSDVFVFLQEKDQKYAFAMLDQRCTVISLQKLIVREVANEERGLFLITAGIEKPEMMEVLASSKDERNTWMQLIQEAMQSMEKDEDEGIPSETEDDKRQLETKAKEMRGEGNTSIVPQSHKTVLLTVRLCRSDLLRQKDTEIMSLLEEKVQLFRGMWEPLNPGEEVYRQVQPLFRSACSLEPPGGASIMLNALQEVETLQGLVNGSLGGAMAGVQEGGGAGPVCLPRRAETFGGFDSHQMHSSKSGDVDESEDTAADLRRTESDSVLKKGGNGNTLQLLKRNSEQFLNSVSNLHYLLSTLQAVVVQQDSFIEDQRQALSERSSSLTSLSRASSRPSSLIEQEKQRSLEKQRQELASLQRQQAAHAEEKRKREKEWETREQRLTEREGQVHTQQEEEVLKMQGQLEEEKHGLQSRKEEYQRDLERLRDAQRKLERDREAVQRELDKMEERSTSTTSEESLISSSPQSLQLDPPKLSSSSSSSSSSLLRLQPQRSKPKGKGLNPFTSSSSNLRGGEANHQISKSLLQLAKNKSKEEKEKEKKKKKKSKGGSTPEAGRE